MKRNPNNVPTICTVSLARVFLDNLSMPKDLEEAPFQATFHFGDKNDLHIGEVTVVNATCKLSEETYQRLRDFISSFESDIALSIFKTAPVEPEVKKEEQKETFNDYDETFQLL